MTAPTQQKNPVEILEKQARLLEYLYQELRTLSNRQPVSQKREFSLSKHAGSGAIVTVMIATLWVAHYLATTEYGISLYGSVIGSSLLDYVTGQAHNMETFGTEASFVVISRFVIGFGFSWAPATLLIASIRKFI